MKCEEFKIVHVDLNYLKALHDVIRQIKRGLFCQIKTGLSEYLTMV